MISEVIVGILGAAIGAAAAIGTPWVAERIKRRGSDREQQLQAIVALRVASREVLVETQSAVDALFSASAAGAGMTKNEVAGRFCDLAHRTIGVVNLEATDLHSVAARFNDSVHHIWDTIETARRQQPLLSPDARSRYDADLKREFGTRLAEAASMRDQMKVLMRVKVESLGGFFPAALVSDGTADPPHASQS